MKLYVVRNKDGKFFRPIGMGGCGKNWQDTIERAKFYPKIGTAKGQASFWYKEYPSYGCPDILEFDLDPAKAIVLDIQQETEIKIKKAKQKILQRSIETREFKRQCLEQQQREIADRLRNLDA